MTVHRGQLLTAAIVAALEADDLIVGEGVAPETGVGWQGSPGASTFIGYVAVHAVPGGVFDGTISAPFEDARPDYIISSFGATQEQTQFLNDRVFAVLTTSTLAVSGRVVQLAIPDVEGGVVRDDTVTPPIYHAPTRWRVFTTSS